MSTLPIQSMSSPSTGNEKGVVNGSNYQRRNYEKRPTMTWKCSHSKSRFKNLCLLTIIFSFQFCDLGQCQNIFGTVSKNVNDIKFYLYANPYDEDDRSSIEIGNILALQSSQYNSSLPLTILMHGALSNSLTFTDVRQIKDAYIRTRYPTNVLMVDFGPLTQSGLPFLASPLSVITAVLSAFNMHRIALHVSDFIIFLMENQVLSGPENVHLIGFSISGAIVGFIGKIIQRKTQKKIRRISGLDPMPYLALLDKTDGEFVDITLTSFGFVPPFIPPIVHAQFYVNRGGRHQPNCPNIWPVVETYCSHSTSVFYFAKSIRTKPVACRCTQKRDPVPYCYDKTIYGQHLSPKSRGNFCLKLN